MSAILFLYQEVLKQEIGWLGEVVRAKKAKKLPVVLTREEVKAVLSRLSGTRWIMANLLYGSGLRLMECIRLRVKDIDFSCHHIVIRDGKGDKDRVTMLPLNVKNLLQRHLQEVKQLHERDLKQGFGSVYLPYALESTLMPIVNGIGNMYCPLRSVRLTHVRVLNGGIMSVHWCCSEP